MKKIFLLLVSTFLFSIAFCQCPDQIVNGNFKGNLGAWDYDSDWWYFNNGFAAHNPGDGNNLSQHGLLISGNHYYVRALLIGTTDSVTIKLGGNGTSKTYSSNAGSILFEGEWNGDYKIAFYPFPNSDVRIDNVSMRVVNCE